MMEIGTKHMFCIRSIYIQVSGHIRQTSISFTIISMASDIKMYFYCLNLLFELYNTDI